MTVNIFWLVKRAIDVFSKECLSSNLILPMLILIVLKFCWIFCPDNHIILHCYFSLSFLVLKLLFSWLIYQDAQ